MKNNRQPNRFLKWSFGSSLDRKDLRFGYLMKVVFTSPDCAGDAQLEWEYGGRTCIGAYFSSTSIVALNFLLPESTVLLTYRLLDTDSLLPSLLHRWLFMAELVTVAWCCCDACSDCGHGS